MLIERSNLDKKRVLLLEQGIQYLGIINKQGRLQTNISIHDVNITEKKKEILFMQQKLQNTMDSEFDENFGYVKYTITEREHSKILSIPIFPYLAFAIIDKSSDIRVLVPLITEIIKESLTFSI